ncbi:MAG: Uma2 family endonuclease [Byssovorax sp.]
MRSAVAKIAVAPDPTVYPIEDDMGEGTLQRLVSETLRVLIERWLASQGKPAFVGANQLFYWKQFDASEHLAPDVYVLPGAPLSPNISAWKVWETGFVPSFAFEFISGDPERAYRTLTPRYGRLGVDELIVFDADFEQARDRTRFQIYRPGKKGWTCVQHTDADRVRSKVLGCHLRVVGEGGALRVRLATGFNGEDLVPTDAEAEQAARRALEAHQRATATAQAERARLEAEIARLRAAADELRR